MLWLGLMIIVCSYYAPSYSKSSSEIRARPSEDLHVVSIERQIIETAKQGQRALVCCLKHWPESLHLEHVAVFDDHFHFRGKTTRHNDLGGKSVKSMDICFPNGYKTGLFQVDIGGDFHYRLWL